MATTGGPNIVRDGLVFGYDTGHGVADNNTPTRFYPGENTANLFPSPNFTNHADVIVGTTSVIKQDFGDGRIGIQMIQAGTSDIAGFSMGSYSAPVSAGTYTWSSFIHSTSTGGKVKAQVTVYVNGVRHWLTSSNTWSTSVVECNHLFIATVANQWHRIENQFTLPTGTLTNLQLGSFYRTTSNFTIKIANAQLELKSHTTPFLVGTRSSTASLIDLKKTANIDVSNVSFDSTGQPTFDATNDYVNVPNASNLNLTSQGTISVWINPSTLTQGSYAGLVSKALGGSSNQQSYGLSWRQVSNAFWGEICNGSGTYNQVTAPFPTVANVWYNIVFTWNGSQLVIYNNGVSVGTLTQTINCQTLATDLTIGGYTYKGAGGSNEYFNGKISNVKLYNIGLTATEVQQNYNAYKNRFDI